MRGFGVSKAVLLGCSALALTAGAAFAQTAPIVQPGAPGQAARALTAEEASRIADNRFSADDVAFMQGMILHHQQAVDMAALVEARTGSEPINAIAGRIRASQADEIEFMRAWLRERGQTAPNPAEGHGMHEADHGAGHAGMDHGAGHEAMAGMATPEQMAAMAAAEGPAFERLFLERMIAHHEGALKMVADLLARPGSAYDPVLFDFTNDVKTEQEAEIARMSTLLREGSANPRATLSPGFRDAGEAISGMRMLASLEKPVGFFDPENPAGLPPPIPAEPREGETDAAEAAVRYGSRSPFLSFANTDMAFSGDLMAVGNYHGVNLYRLGTEAAPTLISSVVCPGGQGDVSIVGDLLIMSVEQNSGRVDCGREGVGADASPERFRGLRIFDISNPVAPVQVGQVQTCRGSHTHSVVADRQDAIIVYNSGTAGVRDEEELATCVSGALGDPRTALFRIDVIEIPKADPSRARIIDSPAVFADENGAIAGLWTGGDHGEGTQTTSRTDQCHDITVFPALNLAAGACSGNGVIFDITDPRKPQRVEAVTDEGFAYWHSATFNNDGTKVLFTDEWGGGARPRCRVQDPVTWGADAIYDIVDGKLEKRAYFKIPAGQTDKENCVAHNGSIVPVPGRDIFVQSWYQGGLSVMDFTDSAAPREIAYFDRGPISGEHAVLGGYWSSYWYGGRIYATEIVRGLDVLALEPSEHLTANEIAAAALADQGRTFNPQTQERVTWPDHPVVALAYIDQLKRDGAMDEAGAAPLVAALEQARGVMEAGGENAALAGTLTTLAGGVGEGGTDATGRRRAALRETLGGIATALR